MSSNSVIGIVFLKFAGDIFEKSCVEHTQQYGGIPALIERQEELYNE